MERILDTIHCLATMLAPKIATRLPNLLRTYTEKMDRKIHHEGKSRAVEHFKHVHLIAKCVALNVAFSPIPFAKSDNRGIPRELWDLLPLLNGTPEEKRFALTITRSYERIYLEAKWDPTPITGDGVPLDPNILDSFSEFCKSWVKSLGIENVKFSQLDMPDWVLNVAKGPNGPSVLMSHVDAYLLAKEETLMKAIRQLSTLGYPKTADMIDELAKEVNLDSYTGRRCLSRIALISEGGGKTRTIGIGDYWTQVVLKPLHKKLMQILQRLDTDGTWDQDSQAQRCAQRSLGYSTYCFDLTSATDRFPVEIQRVLLQWIIGSENAEAWKTLLTSRDFLYQDTNVRWKVGQPLGILSSWAAFALTHHAAILYCAYLADPLRKGRFSSYSVLGDDVVIWDKAVAQQYEILMEKWGIPINHKKSIVGTHNDSQIEFAKRIFIRGVEITPFRWDLLRNSTKTLAGLAELYLVSHKRGCDFPWTEVVVPSYLPASRKEILLVYLFYRIGVPFSRLNVGKVRCTYGIVLDRMKYKVYNMRIKRLQEASWTHSSMPVSLLDKELKRWGWTTSTKSSGMTVGLHPILGVQICIIEEIARISSYDYLSATWSNWEDSISPVEYIPAKHMGAYYGNSFLLRHQYLCTLVLKAWKDERPLLRL